MKVLGEEITLKQVSDWAIQAIIGFLGGLFILLIAHGVADPIAEAISSLSVSPFAN
jgi:hypothetical protein